MASMNALVKKICQVNTPPDNPNWIYCTMPHTIRPASIALIKQRYNARTQCHLDILYKKPDTAPYVINSNAMAVADGKKTGIPNKAERSRGNMKPTRPPYFHPQISPHRNTGMCIGNNLLPICGICPVKKGSISPNARNIAATVIFFND